jgi:hypothetical protein
MAPIHENECNRIIPSARRRAPQSIGQESGELIFIHLADAHCKVVLLPISIVVGLFFPCRLRQRRNDGSDSRQLSIQSRLQLLEGGLDF